MIIDRAIVRSSEQHKSILHSAFAFGFRKYVTYIQCDHWVSENIDEFVLNAHTNSIAATQIDDYRIHIQEFPYIFFFFWFFISSSAIVFYSNIRSHHLCSRSVSVATSNSQCHWKVQARSRHWHILRLYIINSNECRNLPTQVFILLWWQWLCLRCNNGNVIIRYCVLYIERSLCSKTPAAIWCVRTHVKSQHQN